MAGYYAFTVVSSLRVRWSSVRNLTGTFKKDWEEPHASTTIVISCKSMVVLKTSGNTAARPASRRFLRVTTFTVLHHGKTRCQDWWFSATYQSSSCTSTSTYLQRLAHLSKYVFTWLRILGRSHLCPERSNLSNTAMAKGESYHDSHLILSVVDVNAWSLSM